MGRGLTSDNQAGVLPEVMEALVRANHAHMPSYGADPVTHAAKQAFRNAFEADVDVAFVFNGTGANVLGIACCLQPFHAVLCADSSHLYVDESTAPETFIGARLFPLTTNTDGKVEAETVRKAIIRKGDEHHPQVKVLSLTQSTEYGTVYSLDELRELTNVARAHGLLVHMDGARLCNAAASLNCSFADVSAGVDVVSFGGTKAGMMFGEAVVFLNRGIAVDLKYRHKQSMQLGSKARFIAAQFQALLQDDVWRRAATHANHMARKLGAAADALARVGGVQRSKPVQSNAVFATIPRAWNAPLQAVAPFSVWTEATNEVRWMCSFDTTDADVDAFVDALRALSVQA